MKILEEFWYGNIEPSELDSPPSKEYKELLQLICRNEEKLQATFTDEQKELFSRYSVYFIPRSSILPVLCIYSLKESGSISICT